MPAYVVVQVTVRDPVKFEEYKKLAPPTIAAHGGRYLARGGASETLEGAWQPARLVILEFPNPEQARRWWAPDQYAAAKKLRQSCSTTDMVLVEGL